MKIQGGRDYYLRNLQKKTDVTLGVLMLPNHRLSTNAKSVGSQSEREKPYTGSKGIYTVRIVFQTQERRQNGQNGING